MGADDIHVGVSTVVNKGESFPSIDIEHIEVSRPAVPRVLNCGRKILQSRVNEHLLVASRTTIADLLLKDSLLSRFLLFVFLATVKSISSPVLRRKEFPLHKDQSSPSVPHSVVTRRRSPSINFPA